MMNERDVSLEVLGGAVSKVENHWPNQTFTATSLSLLGPSLLLRLGAEQVPTRRARSQCTTCQGTPEQDLAGLL